MSVRQLFQTSVFWLLLVLMICAGSCEAVIAQWSSAFAESALHVSKTIGDLAGPCGFAVFMGISRVLFGRFGEKVDLTAFMIASGALCVVCYLLVGARASVPLLGLTGCMLCGFAVGIMWPGSISISSSILPSGGLPCLLLALRAIWVPQSGRLWLAWSPRRRPITCRSASFQESASPSSWW